MIVGTSEALADIYLGPLVSGSVSTWFAYVLALAFLLVRPAGLFGERQIERCDAMTTTELESPVTLPVARSLTRQRLLIAAGLAIALIVVPLSATSIG